MLIRSSCFFVEINSYARLAVLLRLVVEGACHADIRVGFEELREVADLVLVDRLVGDISAGLVRVLHILNDKLLAGVDVCIASEVLDDLEITVFSAVESYLLAVLYDVKTLQVLAAGQRAHVPARGGDHLRLERLSSQRAESEIVLEESVYAAVDLSCFQALLRISRAR